MLSSKLLKSLLCALAISWLTLVADSLYASKSTADEQAGAVLFSGQGCTHCHGADASGSKKGPDLRQIRKDKNWTPEKITNQILNGGKKMPAFSDSLTDAQIAQVVAWLRAKHRPIPPPGADANPMK